MALIAVSVSRHRFGSQGKAYRLAVFSNGRVRHCYTEQEHRCFMVGRCDHEGPARGFGPEVETLFPMFVEADS